MQPAELVLVLIATQWTNSFRSVAYKAFWMIILFPLWSTNCKWCVVSICSLQTLKNDFEQLFFLRLYLKSSIRRLIYMNNCATRSWNVIIVTCFQSEFYYHWNRRTWQMHKQFFKCFHVNRWEKPRKHWGEKTVFLFPRRLPWWLMK